LEFAVERRKEHFLPARLLCGAEPEEPEMCKKYAKKLTLAALMVVLYSIAPSSAQTPPPNTGPTSATTSNPELQRQLAPSRRATKKQRIAACEMKLTQQRTLSRYRFMRQCLRG
jgi:hypothetical protein